MRPAVETHVWPLPPDLLVIAVEEGDETAISLIVTTHTPVAGPGDALVELVHALAGARLAVTPQEPPHE